VTPEKLGRLAVLQAKEREVGHGSGPTDAERDELDALRRELAMAPEVADDKSTLFTDESSRPNLDGSNYNDTLHRMTCDELGAILERVGRVGFEVAVAAVLKR
jgi:hypothetical protein